MAVGEYIAHESAKLTAEGGGEGRSVYISAGLIRKFGLQSVRDVDLFVSERDGKLAVVMSPGRGFGRQDLINSLNRADFEIVHEGVSEDFWSVVGRKGQTEVRVDSNAAVASNLLNNVSVKGPVFHLSERAAYADLYEMAVEAGLSLGIDDERQIWSRILSSPGEDLSNPPTPPEAEPILEEIGETLVYLKKETCSLLTTPDEVVDLANTVQDVSETATEKLGLTPQTPF